jgi:hypothetical protein
LSLLKIAGLYYPFFWTRLNQNANKDFSNIQKQLLLKNSKKKSNKSFAKKQAIYLIASGFNWLLNGDKPLMRLNPKKRTLCLIIASIMIVEVEVFRL